MLEARIPFFPVGAGELVGGKYRVESVLGEGGMGVVFAATHIDLHCPVALKVIRPEFQQQPELIARLMLEARAAAQIRSEHVCRVLDVARLETGVPYVVMEYLEGKNLAMVLDAKGRLGERVAVDYVLQACEALAEAHRIGIVHRDLKPENLFLAEFPDGRRAIKVLDFGISKVVGATVALASSRRLTNPSAAMGSPHYMAPEQMAAASDVDSRADIWALGTILHQLVTGCFAFDGTSLPAVCAAVLQSDPVPVRSVVNELSADLEHAVLACLVKDRDQRIGSVADLAQRLAPLGSPSATQSALRIGRLMSAPGDLPESSTNHTGTLVSPRHLPTPHTPMPATTAITEQAVTSSKPFLPEAPVRARKSRMPLALVVVALLLLAGWGIAKFVNATHGGAAADSVPTVGSSRTQPAATMGVVAATQERALASPTSDSMPHPGVTATSNTNAVVSNALVAPTPSSSALVMRSATHPETARTVTPIPRRKPNASKDPYNLDNFGGRR
jgi:serine/threonine-protein kinase